MKDKIMQIRAGLSKGLQGRQGVRMLLVGVMVLLFLLAGLRWGLNAYHSYAQQLQQEIEVKETRYDNLARFIAEAEKYKQEHRALVQFQEDYLASRLIQASTPSLAEAQLQDLVNKMAEDAGLNVRSMRMRSREQANGVTLLRINISSRGKIEAIQEFLQQAAQQDQFLFVDEMEAGVINRREKRYFNFNAQLVAWTRT